MDEFVIETIDPDARLVFSNRQVDSETEFVVGFDCELVLPKLSPIKTTAARGDEFHTTTGITTYFQQMSHDWTGWKKSRRWHDHWNNLIFECRNSGQRNVEMAVELRPSYEFEPVTAWKICASLRIEISQLERIARHAAAFFGAHPS